MDYTPCRTAIYEAWNAARNPHEYTAEQVEKLKDSMVTTNMSLWIAVGTIAWIMAEHNDSWDEHTVNGIGEALSIFSDLGKGIDESLDSLTSERVRQGVAK